MLSIDVLNEMVDLAGNLAPKEVEKCQPIGRTIAPVNEPEPVKIQYRNNLPDWSDKDFSGMATDVDNDILSTTTSLATVQQKENGSHPGML